MDSNNSCTLNRHHTTKSTFFINAFLVFSLLLWGLLIFETAAEALGSKGPSLSTEINSNSKVVISEPDSDTEIELEMSKTTHVANLYAPLGGFGGGSFILNINGTSQERKYTGESDEFSELKILRTLKNGLIYLPEKTASGMQVFLVASRYGSFAPRTDIRALGEYIIGADTDVAQYGLDLPGTHSNRGRALARIRNYKYGNEYLVVIEYRFKVGDRWAFEVSIPSHIKAEWTTADDDWGFYFYASGSSFQSPFKFSESQGWAKGTTLQTYLGARKHIASIVYGALEAGIQNDETSFYDEEQNLLRMQTSKFSPWARLKIETYLP